MTFGPDICSFIGTDLSDPWHNVGRSSLYLELPHAHKHSTFFHSLIWSTIYGNFKSTYIQNSLYFITIFLYILTQGVFFIVIMIYFHQEYKNNGENDGGVEVRHIEGSTKASNESVSPHYCYNHSRGKFYAETFNQTCHHCCTTWERDK